ncbi:AAA family ATPase [Mitsuaria sp. 7]|uniref:AAA family ATPase n=1 Tax=Mitsuaria sp. 7 TaxID=1658665 RepID=UPI0012F77DC6|nr:AAA family ATPase [Mitsuaria sp. 7]
MQVTRLLEIKDNNLQGEDMKFEIKHCNNIESAIFNIEPGRLNVKYAINGTGKSTLAKALSLMNQGAGALASLVPFKYRGVKGAPVPEVVGLEQIASAKIFNEAYINGFVFQPDDMLKGSFDLLVRSPEYDSGVQQIDDLVQALRKALSGDSEIEQLVRDFDELSASFGKPAKGIHGSSPLAKAFKEGNRVENIPEGLEAYKPYIQHQNGFKWIKWQQDGAEYLEVGHDCPYCTNDIETKRETIKKVAETYDPKSVENLNKIVSTFERLNKYFSEGTRQLVDKFVRNTEAYNDQQVGVLLEIKTQIDSLNAQFKKSREIGFLSLKEVGKVIEELKGYVIDLDLFNHLKSDETKAKVAIVNSGVQSLSDKAGLLQGAIVKQQKLVRSVVEEYSDNINSFLRNAGYSYEMHLRAGPDGQHRLKLKHKEADGDVSEVREHLSFGERNAVALVLFMFDAIKSNAPLIVLDDPISSFDKNKKYAIVDMLFRRQPSLRGKTVLLLTHDIDPVVDMLVHHTDRFDPPVVCFLENVNGVLSEKSIQRGNVKTFLELHDENLNTSIPMLNRLVYLRRLYEITHDKGFEFDILSNIFHKRDVPQTRDVAASSWRLMTQPEIDAGVASIKSRVPDFDYATIIATVQDRAAMKALYSTATNNYEKLHLYRIMFDDSVDGVGSDVVLKFINEAFHIENNSIYQLNPREYQMVPQFVISECDRYVAKI